MDKFVLISLLFQVVYVASSSVLDLSGAGAFKSEVGKHDIMLVEFFAPWCGHCKKLAPEYEISADKLQKTDPSVALAKVDCTNESGGKEVCSQYGVTGYPTLKIFRNGEFSVDYEGGRNADGIIKEMKKQSAPMAKEVNSLESLKKSLQGTSPVVVGFFAKDGEDKTAFVQAASKLYELFKMVYSLSEDINTDFGITDNTVRVFRPAVMKNKFEEVEVTMTESITKNNIVTFATEHGFGSCPVMTSENKDVLKKPVVIAYYDVNYLLNPKGTNYWRNRVMKVAQKYTSQEVSFAVASVGDFGDALTEQGFDVKTTPVIQALDAAGSKFNMEGSMTPDGKSLDAFVTQFLAGELEPYLKSEAIPASNDGPVKVVVGKTFNDIVLDETKDVLIEFYAPWCGHCKSLEPTYAELAEKVSGAEHVVIAKMDATANDSPVAYAVSGFPTIYWAPMGKKSKPQKYQGSRDLDGFVDFIKKESTKPVSLDSKKKSKSKTDEL